MMARTLVIFVVFSSLVNGFQPLLLPAAKSRVLLAEKNDNDSSPVEEYKNVVTSVLANFMQKPNEESAVDPLASINFDTPKITKLPIEKLAARIDKELYEKEWFVTGNVNPAYFSNDFEFQDPDVKLTGIEDYARGVYKLFDQETSRAEIISTRVTDPTSMTVEWRLSGRVNIGPGINIKPYICYSDFRVDQDGLICFQEDRFDIPSWDILLSSLFPFLIGTVTAPPAPPVEPRTFPDDDPEDGLEKLKEAASSFWGRFRL